MHAKPAGQRRLALLGSVISLLLAFSLPAQPPATDYAALRGQMRVLEKVVDEILGQTFSSPFGLLEKTKGAYLEGFGVVFTLQVNLYSLRITNPMAVRPLTPEELEKVQQIKRERIATIKRVLPRLLADHTGSLRALKEEDSVAVVVHLFDVNPPAGKPLPAQLVLQVKKLDLDRYWARQLSFEELVARIKLAEF